MTVIGIRELGQDGDGTFRVRISFDDEAEYEAKVTDPADEAMENGFAWYFEQHLRYPFLDRDKEAQAVEEIARYGTALFGQVFGGDASHDYRNLRAESFDGCRVEVSGSAALHRLHWEALRDPELPVGLSVRMPVTRRADKQPSKFKVRTGLPTLNILVITARPDGPGDVGYRTISRPLMDALRTAGLPVTVDLVRPGTWQALRDHLRAATEHHGSGWYQVIHFDLHGAFQEYGPLEAGRQADRLLFTPGMVTQFQGQRGFLFFETGQDRQAEPVPAENVAALLEEHRLPVAILNACQSAMQSDSEAGLAQRLAESGVPVALGMAYSVTVSAAERAMPVLYRRIADGAELTLAVTAARRELHDHRARQAYFGQELDLEDWMLPVMFGQRSFQIQLRDMTDEEQRDFYQRQAEVAVEPPTEYGFVGRDLDIQAIEHRLLATPDSNELLVLGMAGAGKSTLLEHLGWWWQRTGLVGQVFRFSYEGRAWTSSQIVRQIRTSLMDPAEHARADTLSEEAQAEQVARLLRASRHLLILDNAESITLAPAAIPHSLSPRERENLKAFLSRLRGGRTLVLLGSRGPEEWLTSGQGPAIYPLPGLDPQAASLLVDKILDRHAAIRWLVDEPERQALQELVTLLGGYPLPLTVVLPVLASAPPSQVLAELQEGLSGPDPAGLITRAIEYSHGKLDPALQNSLQLLAPFISVIDTLFLQKYQELLLGHEAVQATARVDLVGAVAQAVSVGLATSHGQLRGLVQLQPVLPWFLRNRLAAQPALQAATDHAHYQLYSDYMGPVLNELLASQDSAEDRALGIASTEAEYANLRAALSHALRTGQNIEMLVVPLDGFLAQIQQHDARRQLLDQAIAAYPESVSRGQQGELGRLHDRAGHTALAQQRSEDAGAHYRIALSLLQEAGERRGMASVHHQLGIVAERQRRLDEAEASYRQALEIFLELGDRHRAANGFVQLGTVAQRQRRFADAEASHRQALEIFLEFGDRLGAAISWHQLGTVAQEQHRFADAVAAYRQALAIKLEFGDRHRAASTYHQLGTVAQERRRFADAEASYRQALEIFLEFGDGYGAASTYHQLGAVAQERQRFAEAEACYRQALALKPVSADPHRAGTTYHQLGLIAEKQRRLDEAEASYRQALEIFLKSDRRDASGSASRLGVVLSELGQHRAAAEAFLYAVITWRQETGHWDDNDLRLLKRKRDQLGEREFTMLVQSNVPGDLLEQLLVALEQQEITPETDDTGGG